MTNGSHFIWVMNLNIYFELANETNLTSLFVVGDLFFINKNNLTDFFFK